MTQRFVICDHGVTEANLVPEVLLGRPGFCPHGIYETVLLKEGKPVDWAEHWARLQNSCAYLGIQTENLSEMISPEAITRLLILNRLSAGLARMRIQVFHEDQATTTGDRFKTLVAVWPVRKEHPASFTIAISKLTRQHLDVSYHHKLMGRTYVEEELISAIAQNCNDVVFLNDRQELCEGVYSNIWLVMGDTVATPPISSPCLPGITRKKVMMASRAIGISVVENEPLSTDALIRSDGAFLTSSIRGIQQVHKIKDRTLFPNFEHTREVCALLANSLESG